MSNFKNSIFIVAVIIFSGCSEKEVIIPPFQIEDAGRTVLIEELTGVRCPNCPSANARLESIKFLYGDNIIKVAIHGDLLTLPLPESRFDFRNPHASLLENSFRPLLGKPSIVINRKILPGFNLMANPVQDQWQSLIESELQKEQILGMTASISEREENWIIDVAILPVIPVVGNLSIHAFVIENHIIDPQQDVNTIIMDYEHNNVFRRMITPIEGHFLGDRFESNSIIQHAITWDRNTLSPLGQEDHLHLVLFITNGNGEVEHAVQYRLRI